MVDGPKEQEPGKTQKVERYKQFRHAQKTAEKALGELTIEEAETGAAGGLINIKDQSEQAAGIIRRDLKIARSPKKPYLWPKS